MPTEILHFDVGGTPYNVAKDTLLKSKDTVLAKLVSEKWTADQETIFIDRDGERFKYILETAEVYWYRDGRIIVPITVALDADFFGLQEDAVIEEKASINKLLYNLRDDGKCLDELNRKLKRIVETNEVSNVAIWTIQEMLKNLKVGTKSCGKIEVNLFENDTMKNKFEKRYFDLLSEEIKQTLATDKFLSASQIIVTRNYSSVIFNFV
jgi:hypothetical protein